MASLLDISKKIKEMFGGLVQQTPFANPSSNAGNNFWYGPVAQKAANLQQPKEIIVFNDGHDRLTEQIAIGSGSAYPGASTVSMNYSDVQGGNATVYVDPAATLTWGTGNIDADPLFKNPTAGDYHLLPNSPCIDAGTTLKDVTKDIRGMSRPKGSAYDIGAFEWQ
jgi:hypothetical protein